MKALFQRRKTAHVSEVPVPILYPDELLTRLEAVALNPVDLIANLQPSGPSKTCPW